MASVSVAAAQKRNASPPELMIVGVPHFDNPGRDIADSKIEDVLTPERQRDIAALVARLAAFHPNHVAIEWPAIDQAGLDRRYAAYRAGRYRLTRDERDQIGLRLAVRLGLPRVDTADWNDEPPGQDADYDFPAWLKAHGKASKWDAYQHEAQTEADQEGAYFHCHAVADWVRFLAEPTTLARFAEPYFRIATFGDTARNPGAAWVGAWYARNLRIFDNLMDAGGTPGDRTIAIFGAGHAPWLRSDAQASGRFVLIDPRDYLPPPAPARC